MQKYVMCRFRVLSEAAFNAEALSYAYTRELGFVWV